MLDHISLSLMLYTRYFRYYQVVIPDQRVLTNSKSKQFWCAVAQYSKYGLTVKYISNKRKIVKVFTILNNENLSGHIFSLI